jgi:hypothetical protein
MWASSIYILVNKNFNVKQQPFYIWCRIWRKWVFFLLRTILIPFLQSFDSNNTAVFEENKNKINVVDNGKNVQGTDMYEYSMILFYIWLAQGHLIVKMMFEFNININLLFSPVV